MGILDLSHCTVDNKVKITISQAKNQLSAEPTLVVNLIGHSSGEWQINKSSKNESAHAPSLTFYSLPDYSRSQMKHELKRKTKNLRFHV